MDWQAEHLAKENRYNGSTIGKCYSVAEHAVRCADAAYEATKDLTLAGYLLLHDNHEALLKDETTPKKRALAELATEHFGVLAENVLQVFKLLEYRHDLAIHTAAGMPWPPAPEMQIQIKHWDDRLLVTEWRDLMRAIDHPCWEPYKHIPPLPFRIKPYPHWKMAKWKYLDACKLYLPSKHKGYQVTDGSASCAPQG